MQRLVLCTAKSQRMKAVWGNARRHLNISKARALYKSGDINLVSFNNGLCLENYKLDLSCNKVLYTAIFGNKDRIPSLKILPKNWDMVVFTDNAQLESKVWRVVLTNPPEKDPTRSARYFKLNPHLFFPEHTISAWIDANILLTCNPTEYFDRFIKGHDFACLRHWQDVKGPYHEVERCISLNKDDKDILIRQGERYKKEGLPESAEVVWTAVLIRKHTDPRVIEFDSMWWKELSAGSKRDQIAFPYCAWKLNFKYSTIPGLGPYFRRINHVTGGWR